jgi:transposase
VYDLYQEHIRLDATVCGGFHEVEAGGLMQVGHAKDGRDDLAQFKLMAAATGKAHYISGQCAPGNHADDPLYLPLFLRIIPWLPTAGMLFVGDCKMCALPTRATIANAHHLYYMPLAQNHVAAEEYVHWVTAAVAGTLPALTAIWREEELLGYGYEFDREQCCGEIHWTERVHVIRSLAMIAPGVQAIDRHIARATKEIYALTPPPKQGHHQIQDAQQLKKSITKILHRYHLDGAITVTWTRDETYKQGKAVRFVVTGVEVHAEYVRELKHQTGWRVFVTNASPERLPLDQGVLLYRQGAGQGVERMYAMLKGTPIGISPLFVRNDEQIIGLVYLLTLALRVLSYFETSVREALAQTNEELPDYHPGGKSSAHPTAKTMLERITKRGVTLLEILREDGTSQWMLSRPPPILQKIMALLQLPASTYEKLLE